MPKWTSPIFTDIRNALGESVVFSMWKGRPYMRSWVKPANPRTAKQQAHRDVLRQLVKRWQDVIDTAEKKAAWNAEALSYNITGFNLFTKFGRKSSISCPGTGSTGSAVTITYTLGLPATKAAIYAFDGSTWEDITPPEGLESGENKTFEHTFDSAGTYEIFIADKDVLVEGDTAPQPYQAITKWSPDVVNGVAKEAKIVIS
ncbi:MAG: hypothetical protein ACXQTW_08615 [Candidatus Methanospirareceae archaeon]